MKKFSELIVSKQNVIIYFLSIIFSLITYPLFYKLYVVIYHPVIRGSSFFIIPEWLATMIVSSIYALYFYLAFLVFLFIKKNTTKVWFYGALIPFIIALLGGGKDLFIAFILSVAGWLLAQGGLILYNKLKK